MKNNIAFPQVVHLRFEKWTPLVYLWDTARKISQSSYSIVKVKPVFFGGCRILSLIANSVTEYSSVSFKQLVNFHFKIIQLFPLLLPSFYLPPTPLQENQNFRVSVNTEVHNFNSTRKQNKSLGLSLALRC